MTVTICLPATEVSIDAMASVDTPSSGGAGYVTSTALRPPGPQRTPMAPSTTPRSAPPPNKLRPAAC